METGAEDGMWSYPRYRAWLDKRTNFNVAPREIVADEEETVANLRARRQPEQSPVKRGASRACNRHFPKAERCGPSRIEIEPTEVFEKYSSSRRDGPGVARRVLSQKNFLGFRCHGVEVSQ